MSIARNSTGIRNDTTFIPDHAVLLLVMFHVFSRFQRGRIPLD
jgi:hypothetical protein